MSNRRKQKGRPVSGWLILDKPVGMTSTHAVAQVKRLFEAQKAGHAGTLDPLASGCLPIALGEATKAVPHVFDGRKVYRFTIRWGIETDTDDAEGKVVATAEARPRSDEIAIRLTDFLGEIMQTPPAFSAIKIAGERAYDLARDGEAVVLEPRPVTIHRLDLVDIPDPDHAVLEAECGRGTYVRAIARDLGRALGTRGHVSALRRMVVGPFDEAAMVGITELREAHEAEGPAGCDRFLRPVEEALSGLAEVALTGGDAARVLRGQSVLLRGRDAPLFAGAAYATSAGKLLAVGEIEAGTLHPRRVFNL
jgi:tRNA pseudouridine55 synthase